MPVDVLKRKAEEFVSASKSRSVIQMVFQARKACKKEGYKPLQMQHGMDHNFFYTRTHIYDF